VTVELEAGAPWQGRNDVRIPGDQGTRSSLEELSGDETVSFGRLSVDWDLDARHALRLVVAPLELGGKGELGG